ncbi:putative transmembrane protein [Gregarina niphandrodes]|uniref:Transmembrane protein n=1 Tax=Gregarina niphandrodes TaxID=110365 RepID=A0A023B5S8_GRENI|nr:putative transmembrane protein [Gregarina niphandrodes]EZG62959.1 putative transmembrane protein [Gregarina niphandrodes]|eukprot:XP_011130697.1 putative transmembrane protein [Gregarina niphandrodes]
MDEAQKCLEEGGEGLKVHLFWQNPGFALPCPGEEEDLYLENPNLSQVVDEIFRTGRCGCVLLPWSLRERGRGLVRGLGVSRPSTGSLVRDMDSIPRLHDCRTPLGRAGSLGPPESRIGVLVRMMYCTLLSPSSTVPESEPWVPRRLKAQRGRFENNKIELYDNVKQSCVIKIKAVARVRVHQVEDCGPVSLAFAEPVCEKNRPDMDSDENRIKALALRTKIIALRSGIGQAGRLLYNRRYGDVPVIPSRCGISQLEEISFAIMIPLAIPAKMKNKMIQEMNTEQRFVKTLELLNTNGTSMLRMGLSHSTNRDWLSRIFLGGWNQSIALLIITGISLFLARAFSSQHGNAAW